MSAGGWFTGLLLVSLAATGGFEAWRRAAAAARYRKAFARFEEEHGRLYHSIEEREARFNIFKANLDYIEAENAKGHRYSLGLTAFADQTADEVKESFSGLSGSAPKTQQLWGSLQHLGTDRYSGSDLPVSVDWAASGAVTTPKNQGSCGSCWAFSTTGALEGAWQIATGKLVTLSEQQLVDCAKNGNMGCHGGGMDQAFKYLEDHAACTESSYAYQGKDGMCLESKCTAGIPKGSIVGFRDVPIHDEKALMEAVAKQPVSVAIEADQMAFQLYTGGILTQACGAKLDHGVLIVGYGTENGTDYWKVKNSWGPSWGENGYIRIERGVPLDGECGIKDGPTYPVVSKEEEEPLMAGVFGDMAGISEMAAIAKAMRQALPKKLSSLSFNLAEAPSFTPEVAKVQGEQTDEHEELLVGGVVGDESAIAEMRTISKAMRQAMAGKTSVGWPFADDKHAKSPESQQEPLIAGVVGDASAIPQMGAIVKAMQKAAAEKHPVTWSFDLEAQATIAV
mmetsp:Transcript_33436/g.75679  ORF Transcript_33436/g.75679 Transcript_33436/m.75679 type:complete len:509 (+) Transcript_33436:100-1626(+)